MTNHAKATQNDSCFNLPKVTLLYALQHWTRKVESRM